jgi:hypothetical protein
VTPNVERTNEFGGHSACYFSLYGDVSPGVRFPLPSGNTRRQSPFIDIWRHSLATVFVQAP